MRQFVTTVLERRKELDAPIVTEPYETAWASEATFYVRLHSEVDRIPTLYCRAQTSLDGITWVDLPAATIDPGTAGDHRLPLTHFDGWLRIIVIPADREDYSDVTATLALVLKE